MSYHSLIIYVPEILMPLTCLLCYIPNTVISCNLCPKTKEGCCLISVNEGVKRSHPASCKGPFLPCSLSTAVHIGRVYLSEKEREREKQGEEKKEKVKKNIFEENWHNSTIYCIWILFSCMKYDH